ncbi:ABC transporter ATP-binding protein [Neorhizobium sp. BETTINA12A]|uniref:ABC transporter ATP-binding protein n=1 Tax=unclassified Neorhizobium TaxID=2629175 RepID=UPI001FF3559F|nr:MULTISPECIES: ABC transporter ATP-binding protein [unclassified Neorhizobium]MCJ9671337.1 ABC transporter ATP-binding protein [Neorhizobium sp. SHOUNA12B]MCJ9745821.1 ABC transporter ATP-binding protein [Neorhizobium sp. SHOUNA12A]MCJ9752568.1 ABC transporter ATP-binding protein [Neorhizobium sp. BETTINA12A]
MDGLVLRKLGRRFGAVDAVLDFDLHIKPGEFVSLLGPSGCGKTTTLRMIAGFIDPTSGSIELDGKILSAPSGSVPPEKRGMSMIFQSYAIWPNMTVSQNVAFGLNLRKLPSDEVKKRVGAVLETVRMSHLADRYPAELSGGQQQRVALARAVVIRPAVLLLDEPLSNLDANLREEMRFEIKRMHDEFKITSVYVTHDQGEAMVTSDRIAVMNNGRLEQIDSPYALYSRPKTRFVASFIGRTNFLSGNCGNHMIDFAGFSVPLAMIGEEVSGGGPITVSIRPQAMKLSATEAPREKAINLQGSVRQSSFLGETWDYVFQSTDSGLQFRVAAPPADVFEVGAPAWLQIDPAQIVPIAD